MKTLLIRGVVLAFALLVGAAAQAQSLSELLEKAIYTEETLGNLEGAIRIYEQIINGSVPGTDIRQQAQQRLSMVRASLKNRPAVPLGVFDGRTYRHTRTGLSFNLPPHWVVRNTHPSSDNGERVDVIAVDPEAEVYAWMIPERNDAQSINQKLDTSPAMKYESRKELPNYRYRPGSIQRLVINGKQAIMAIADYGDDRRYVEYLTWIYTERSHTFFWATVDAESAERFRPQFESLLQSTNIP